MSHYSLIKIVRPFKHMLWIVACLLLNTGCGNSTSVDSKVIAKLSVAPCPENATVVQFDYLGACGLTQTSTFTLNTASDVSRIRIWYNTNIGSNPLNVKINGPNGFSWSGATTKGGCDTYQKNWCEGIVNLQQILSKGTYTVDIGSRSMCANPSGQTTLLVYGCQAVLFPPYDFRYTLAGDQLTLNWDATLGADGYHLRWGTSSGSYLSSMDMGNTTQLGPFSIGSLPKAMYYLAVEAYNNTGNGFPSNELTINLANTPSLFAPQQLRYTLNGDSFTLNWDAVTNSTGYSLHFGNQPGQYFTVIDLSNTLQLGPMNVSSLPRGNYYMAVTARNAKIQSALSNEVLVTLKSATTSSNTEIGGFIESIMTLSNDALSGGITEQLQPILSAILGSSTSTCPTVKLNVDLSKVKSLDNLLQNLPKPTIANIDYGTGCTNSKKESFSGSAIVTINNLTVDSVTKNLSVSLALTSSHLVKNGKEMADGNISGTITANLGNATGSGNFDLTNFLVSTGKHLSGNLNLSIIDKTNMEASVDIKTSNDIHIQLPLAATKINDSSMSISTKSPGSVSQYTVTLNSVLYDTNVCKGYPISGKAVFTANGKSQTATFNNRCDGTYTLQ